MQTYDISIASIFNVPIEDTRDLSVNYIEVVKDILKLNYGAVRNPVVR
jgi:hypothetical protein